MIDFEDMDLTKDQLRQLEIAVEFGTLAGVREFFAGVRVISRSQKEPSLWSTDKAAYYRDWRAKNSQRSKEITERYRLKMMAEKPEEFAASRRASRQRHAEKVGPAYFRTAARAARADRAARRNP